MATSETTRTTRRPNGVQQQESRKSESRQVAEGILRDTGAKVLPPRNEKKAITL